MQLVITFSDLSFLPFWDPLRLEALLALKLLLTVIVGL